MHKEANYIVSYAKELQQLGHPYIICILVSKTKHISYLTRDGKKSSQFDNIALLNKEEIKAVTSLALEKFNDIEDVLVMPWEEYEKRRVLCLLNRDSLTTTSSD